MEEYGLIARIVLWFAIVLGVCADVAGCECPSLTEQQAFSEASAVLTGKVTAIEPEFHRNPDKKHGSIVPRFPVTYGYRVHVEVLSAEKGFGDDSATLYQRSLGQACDYPFVPGRAYRIFARPSYDRQGELHAWVCLPTRQLDQSQHGAHPLEFAGSMARNPLRWVGGALLFLTARVVRHDWVAIIALVLIGVAFLGAISSRKRRLVFTALMCFIAVLFLALGFWDIWESTPWHW